MIRFKTVPVEKPEDAPNAKPVKAAKTVAKSATAEPKRDLLDFTPDDPDEKD